MKPRFTPRRRPKSSRLSSAELEERAAEFFRVAEDGSSITCCICGFTSTDPADIQAKYCPVCRVFHEDRMIMARQAEGHQAHFTWKDDQRGSRLAA